MGLLFAYAISTQTFSSLATFVLSRHFHFPRCPFIMKTLWPETPIPGGRVVEVQFSSPSQATVPYVIKVVSTGFRHCSRFYPTNASCNETQTRLQMCPVVFTDQSSENPLPTRPGASLRLLLPHCRRLQPAVCFRVLHSVAVVCSLLIRQIKC